MGGDKRIHYALSSNNGKYVVQVWPKDQSKTFRSSETKKNLLIFGASAQ